MTAFDIRLDSTTLLVACGLSLFLMSCTISRQENAEQNSQPHTSVQPAVVVCLFAACDNQFSDRAQRAGAAANEEGAVEAEQTATSTPTLNVPTGVPAPSSAPIPVPEEEKKEQP